MMARPMTLIQLEKHKRDTKDVKAQIVDLTPKMASELLSKNPKNRPLIAHRVDALAADILSGNWVFNGEPVIVSKDGTLNDGQHRCAAVVQAGKPILTMLVTGVSRESRLTTDMGAARTAGNFLGMNDVKNGNICARVAFLLDQFDEYGAIRDRNPGRRSSQNARHISTKQHVLRKYYKHRDEIDAAVELCESDNSRRLSSMSNFAFCCLLFTRAGGETTAGEFISSFLSGANLAADSPIHKGRERMLSERMDKTLTPNRAIEILIRCWNAWVGAAPFKRLIVNGKIPEVAKV